MLESRLDLLTVHKEKMDSKLIEKIDRFRTFTQMELPQIAVLCSEKVLFNEMQQLFTTFGGADITVYSTFNEEDNIFDIMLSDAIVVVTSALKTAPIGLSSVLEKVAPISKEIYVMLGCWESMPKDPKLANKKSASVPDIFPHSKVCAVRNYFKHPADGFVLPEKAAQDMFDFICNDFSRLRSEQEEKIYQWLKKYVVEYHAFQRSKIYNELTGISNSQRIMTAKQDEYRIRISHLAVSIQSLLDSIENKLSQIRISEIEFDKDDDINSLRSLVSEDKSQAEAIVKKRLVDRIVSTLKNIESYEDTSVLNKGKALSADCINDLMNMCSKIQKMEFVPSQLVEELNEHIENCSFIEDIATQYASLVEKVIESLTEKVKPIVFSYRFTQKPNAVSTALQTGKKIFFDGDEEVRVTDTAKKYSEVKSNTKKIAKDPDEDEEELYEKIDSLVRSVNSSDNYDELVYQAFMDDMKLMLNTSVAQCSLLVGDIAADIKRKIDSDAYDKVRTAFADIFKILTSIYTQLEIEKASYNM